MSYLKFDRRLMSNLDESLQREYIRTNRMGAYCCSSIVGCNTRKYHGALVVPLPELSANNHVLLSSLDFSIVQHGVPFNVGVHEYPGDVFSPLGHKYVREYDVDIASSTTYRVGGVVLRREFYLCHYEHRVIFKFTLLEAHSQTLLRFLPLLAFRDVKMLTRRNDTVDGTVHELKQGIGMRLYSGYPMLCMQTSTPSEFHHHAYWNERILYRKERERGYEHTEDLYEPGYFECPIEVGKPIYFTAGLQELDPKTIGTMFDDERKVRIPRLDFRSCLLSSAQQFYYRPNAEDGYLLAGYPWFGVRARDLFVALPGCSIYADAPERYDRVMKTVIPDLDDYMAGRQSSSLMTQIGDPDVGLWAVWCVQQFALLRGVEEARSRYGAFVSRMIDYYMTNALEHTRLEDTGLLYVYSKGQPVSWMDAKLNGMAVVKREGYLVELNALWYNALLFYKELCPGQWNVELDILAERTERNFNALFINEHGYLFDYVTHQGAKDWSVRPNMIFAVSLPHSPLPRKAQRSVLEYVTRELRTPKGLRTLSPKSEGYRAVCCGSQHERELAYYNGSAWAWLLGPYFEAYMKLYGRAANSFIERTLIGMEEEVQEHGVGTISELFDGNPPYKGRGAISLAMSVGEIIRSLYLLDEAKKKYDDKNNLIIRYV